MGFTRSQAGVVVPTVAILLAIAGCSEVAVPTQTPVEFDATVVPTDTPVPTSTPPSPTCDGDCLLGKELFDISGCANCHSTVDERVVGPGLAGVYSRAARRKVLDADDYIEESLREPQAFLVDGFPPVMPSFDQFSYGDVRVLIEYLKTLK